MKRYNPATMVEAFNGGWVRGSDYDALADLARKACSEMGCYCETDPPDRTCVMCKLGAAVSTLVIQRESHEP